MAKRKINFLTWLHDLTLEGYNKGFTISTDLEAIVKNIFEAGATPADAFDLLLRTQRDKLESTTTYQDDTETDEDFIQCDKCDGHDACRDFGCAYELGLGHMVTKTIS